MNLESRRNVTYARSDQLKHHKSHLLQRVDPLYAEKPLDLYELTKLKKHTKDRIPGNI